MKNYCINGRIVEKLPGEKLQRIKNPKLVLRVNLNQTKTNRMGLISALTLWQLITTPTLTYFDYVLVLHSNELDFHDSLVHP